MDPANISDTTFTDNTAGIEVINTTSATAGTGSNTTDVADCRSVMQLNLAVGFALREEWDKASGLAKQLCLVDGNGGGGNNLGVQVLILNLYIALRKGDIAAAHEILLQRYPSLKHSQNSPV